LRFIGVSRTLGLERYGPFKGSLHANSRQTSNPSVHSNKPTIDGGFARTARQPRTRYLPPCRRFFAMQYWSLQRTLQALAARPAQRWELLLALLSIFLFSCAAKKAPERLTVIAPGSFSGTISITACDAKALQDRIVLDARVTEVPPFARCRRT
jgi:hypothetical protein